ncbi:MAG: hypothetical protein MK193_11430 [Lentisphaeria bacterium]|nr:hypothetical protein [Lentisphaeria bacterium]
MKVVMAVRGGQNNCITEEMQKRGVDFTLYGEWGNYLPEHIEEILALQPNIINLQWPESLCKNPHKQHSENIKEVSQALVA